MEAAWVELAALEAERRSDEERRLAALKTERDIMRLLINSGETEAVASATARRMVEQTLQNHNDLRLTETEKSSKRAARAAVAAEAATATAQPRLGCRPDGTNTACIGAGALAGAAFGGVPGACIGAACGLAAAVKRRFTGQGRKSRKKRGRKHKGKTRKRRKKKTKKRRKKSRKKRTKRRR